MDVFLESFAIGNKSLPDRLAMENKTEKKTPELNPSGWANEPLFGIVVLVVFGSLTLLDLALLFTETRHVQHEGK